MKNLLFILIVFFLIFSLSYTYSLMDLDVESVGGEVISISEMQIVINAYDTENDGYFETAYKIDSETEINGVESINEITVGSTVEIEYIIDDADNFIAKSIYIIELNMGG